MRLATEIQTGTTVPWRVKHAEALLRGRRPGARSLWYLAWCDEAESCLDNPATIYAVADRESAAVLKHLYPRTEPFSSGSESGEPLRCLSRPAFQKTPEDQREGLLRTGSGARFAHEWSPIEAERIEKLHAALCVTRAIYHAAAELNRELTISQIQRRWLTKHMIVKRRDLWHPFVIALMTRERLDEGFIQRTLIFERTVHERAARTILMRTTVILALDQRCALLRRGERIWTGPPTEAFERYAELCLH